MGTKKIEIEVPTSLEDITLRQYQHYMKIVEQNKDENQGGIKILQNKLKLRKILYT